MRHSLVRFLKASVSQDHSRLEILEDQFQDSRIGDAFAELPHEFLMIDGVKERLEVAINHVALFAFGEGFFVHLPDGMMRAPSGSKPVGTIIEDGLVLGRECLRDGLLDQAIEHCRHGVFIMLGLQ